MHDIAVTGIGMVTPLGATAPETVEAWRGGETAKWAALPELLNTPLAGARVAVLPSFDAVRRLGGRKMLKFMSEAAVLGCMAAEEAVGQARIRERYAAERTGLFAAAGLAAADVAEARRMIEKSMDEAGRFSSRLFGERGLAVIHPLHPFRVLANTPACLISILQNIKGPNIIFTPWEGQAGAAIREAWLAVARGEVDCAVTGGADTPAHAATLVHLRQTGRIGESERPASASAYLVFERADRAERAGVPVLAMIRRVVLGRSQDRGCDPLASRMGRTFAAAPALATALACEEHLAEVALVGADGQSVRLELEAA